MTGAHSQSQGAAPPGNPAWIPPQGQGGWRVTVQIRPSQLPLFHSPDQPWRQGRELGVVSPPGAGV